MTTPVAALIVNFNSGAQLERALDDLATQGVHQTLVVDNASHDLSWQAAQGRPGVRLERMDRNLGFAAGVNHGLSLTSEPFVLLLNADVELGPGYVARLAEKLDEDGGLAGVTGLLLLPDGTIDSSGVDLTTARWASDRDRGAEAGAVSSSEPFGVSGAAGLFRREALGQVGGLWEELFVYWEDVELAWRLRRAGWRFSIVPTVRAVHQRGSDSADPTFVEAASFGNRLATIARHEGVPGLLRPPALAATLVTGARLAVRHRRALRTSRPSASIRKGLAGRRSDSSSAPSRPRSLPFSPHPWSAWLLAQVSGGKRGLGAVGPPARGTGPGGT